jgi:hypothetical protein
VALERELETYLPERPRLLAEGQAGRFVVIHGDETLGTYASLHDAMLAGYERYGLDEPFMAREVTETDKPLYFSRNVTHARRRP